MQVAALEGESAEVPSLSSRSSGLVSGLAGSAYCTSPDSSQRDWFGKLCGGCARDEHCGKSLHADITSPGVPSWENVSVAHVKGFGWFLQCCIRPGL